MDGKHQKGMKVETQIKGKGFVVAMNVWYVMLSFLALLNFTSNKHKHF